MNIIGATVVYIMNQTSNNLKESESIIQFEQYLKQYDTLIINFALKLTRDRNAAQELAQIAKIKAFKGFKNFRPGSNFKSWMYTIIKNSYINLYRARKRRNHSLTPIEEMQFAIDRKMQGTNLGEQNLNIEEINSTIDTLSHKIRAPFTMYVEGFKYKEIAELMHIPLGTVKSRINYARKQMQALLSRKTSLAA